MRTCSVPIIAGCPDSHRAGRRATQSRLNRDATPALAGSPCTIPAHIHNDGGDGDNHPTATWGAHSSDGNASACCVSSGQEQGDIPTRASGSTCVPPSEDNFKLPEAAVACGGKHRQSPLRMRTIAARNQPFSAVKSAKAKVPAPESPEELSRQDAFVFRASCLTLMLFCGLVGAGRGTSCSWLTPSCT